MERIEKDRLNDWFARLPDKKLPADFQTLLMERIRQEALLRAERRKERLNLLGMGVLIISLLGGLAVLFFFLGISEVFQKYTTYTYNEPCKRPDSYDKCLFRLSTLIGYTHRFYNGKNRLIFF